MILVDTSVWVDHLRVGDEGLVSLLNSAQVLADPARLWTRDKRLRDVAASLEMAYEAD